MPRRSRIDAPGALHHIICRGIERRRIFKDNQDRDNFIKRLGGILLETKTPCYAWALTPNHFHILTRTGSAPLSTVMRRLLTGYAIYFNRRHRRSGHLFQNRYKSIVCQEHIYLREIGEVYPSESDSCRNCRQTWGLGPIRLLWPWGVDGRS